MLKIEDKSLVKNLQKNVKKMIKPFKGLQYDEYLNNEVHLNQIMATEEQRNDLPKENRKRHMRILDAAMKESVVDTQIVLGICVQISSLSTQISNTHNCAHSMIHKIGNLW